MEESKLVLTGSGLLTFLSQIEELNDLYLELNEKGGMFEVTIGGTTYQLESSDESTVEVSDNVVDSIDDIDEDGYDELMEEYGDIESIEGGIVKELIKTLAVGGLVRLTKDAIANS